MRRRQRRVMVRPGATPGLTTQFVMAAMTTLSLMDDAPFDVTRLDAASPSQSPGSPTATRS